MGYRKRFRGLTEEQLRELIEDATAAYAGIGTGSATGTSAAPCAEASAGAAPDFERDAPGRAGLPCGLGTSLRPPAALANISSPGPEVGRAA